jgi:hypothetical protein
MNLRIIGCLLLLSIAALAQSDRGTITGTIADPAGALVAGAAIELKNSDTGAVYQTETTASGNYTLAQIPVGAYELSVTVPGFKKYLRQNIANHAPRRPAGSGGGLGVSDRY